MSSLATSINAQKKQITDALVQFDKYRHVWMDVKSEVVGQFFSTNPSLDDIEMKMNYYKELEQEVNANEEWVPAGPLALYTGILHLRHC